MLLGMVRAVALSALVRGDAGLAARSDDIVGIFLGGAATSSPVVECPVEEVEAAS